MTLVWPLAIVVSVGVVLAGIFAAGPRLFPGLHPSRRAFRCPFLDQNVDVEFQESVWDGKRVDVTRCSAFVPPTAVKCDKHCVGFESLEAIR